MDPGDLAGAWVLETVEAALRNRCSAEEFRMVLDAIVSLGGSVDARMRGILFADGEICDVTPMAYAALYGRTDALDALLERGAALTPECIRIAHKAGNHAFTANRKRPLAVFALPTENEQSSTENEHSSTENEQS